MHCKHLLKTPLSDNTSNTLDHREVMSIITNQSLKNSEFIKRITSTATFVFISCENMIQINFRKIKHHTEISIYMADE